MVRTKRWVTYAAALGLVVALLPQVQAEEAAKPATKVAPKPAGPQKFLDAVPDDAWGFVAIPSLKNLDQKLGALSEKLNFPIDSPLTLAMGQLGIADGLREEAGLGLVVLDPTEYGTPPDMLVLLLPTTDAKALLEVFDPQETEDGLMRIDLMGEEVFALVKGGFLAVGPEKTAVKHVAGAKKGIAGLLKKDQVDRYKKADIFAMLNLRPAIEMAKPLAGQAVAMLMMDAMDEDPDADERIQKTAQQVVDLLEELNTLEIALGLDDAGLQLSFYLTFLEGEVVKTIAACKGTPSALLAGLPKDKYILAMGVKGGGETKEGGLQDGLAQLALSRSEVGSVIDKAKMAELQKIEKQLEAKAGDSGVSISLLPENSDGMLALTAVWQMKDTKDSMALIRKMVEGYKGVFKDEDIAKVLAGLTCKADAEKVGGVSVDHIKLDLSQLEADDQEVAEIVAVLNKVFGKDGVLIRLAPAGDKHMVATMGGGAKRLEEVIKIASAGKCPLAEDDGVMKARKKMPKNRLFELYVAVDELLKIVKEISGMQEIPQMEKVGAPVSISLAAEKNYGRLDLLIPTELIVEIKNVAMEAMFGGGMGGGTEPSF